MILYVSFQGLHMRGCPNTVRKTNSKGFDLEHSFHYYGMESLEGYPQLGQTYILKPKSHGKGRSRSQVLQQRLPSRGCELLLAQLPWCNLLWPIINLGLYLFIRLVGQSNWTLSSRHSLHQNKGHPPSVSRSRVSSLFFWGPQWSAVKCILPLVATLSRFCTEIWRPHQWCPINGIMSTPSTLGSIKRWWKELNFGWIAVEGVVGNPTLKSSVWTDSSKNNTSECFCLSMAMGERQQT